MKKMGKTVFITGSSGFIGSNLAKRILTTEPDTIVIGLDNMNDYYDVRIKEARLAELQKFENYTFIKGNLADKVRINSIFEQYHPDIVVNLGAQAGVRYSITNPDAYIESNMIGFYNILEACRHYPVEHLVYASSSSVYGSNKKVPYSTDDKVDNPVSLYAATKKSNELMAHAYSKLYNIPSTGLRFFTVYGPAGRPDMAYFGFTNKLVNGETIKIFNYGNCKRDFTYVDDIVEGVVRVDNIQFVQTGIYTYDIELENDGVRNALLSALLQHGLEVLEVSAEKKNLEQVFVKLVNQKTKHSSLEDLLSEMDEEAAQKSGDAPADGADTPAADADTADSTQKEEE